MKFAIQTRLSLGVGLQFFIILVSVGVAIVAINLLTDDTRNILKANYETLGYCQGMVDALDDLQDTAKAIATFQENLDLQQRNVTEPGEQQLTLALAETFGEFAHRPYEIALQASLRQSLSAIMHTNMDAIAHKSEVALATAGRANVVMGTVGTAGLVFALILLINLPNSIAGPIRQFTASLQAIAQRDYALRMDDRRNDEFGTMAASFNAMAAKLEEYESGNLAKMLFEKKRMEALINQMHHPVIGLNAERQVLFANDAALHLLDLPSTALIGQFVDAVARDHAILGRLLRVGAVLDPPPAAPTLLGTAAALQVMVDGKEQYFAQEVVHVTVVDPTDGVAQSIGDVILLQDITPFKELDAAKTQFIATVSHEFKTPISAIQMSLQLLQNAQVGPLNAEQAALAKSIGDDAQRLLKITSELLDFTQVESGQIQLNIRPVNVQEIVQYALDATRTQAEQKRIRMELTVLAPLSPAMADSEKTAWVLTNLIANALRYSTEGSTVFVTVKMDAGRLRIEVRDTGPGIAPAYHDRVFERYFRVPGAVHEGTGLGLAIGKEFIEAQGGQIGLESMLGAGSTFWVELLVS